MTVPSAINKSGPYNGNGVTVDFDYEFRIVDETHIQVILTDASGAETTLALGSDYSVSGVGDAGGGAVSLVVPPANGETLTIIRAVPFTQETDLENQGPYFAQTVEDAFDLAAMRDQQLQEQISRAVKIPASADPEELDQLIEDIVRLQGSADNIDTVAGSIANVNTVGNNIADVDTVAGNIGNVGTVAGISGNVTIVAQNISDVNTVAGDTAEINALASISGDIETVAGISAAVAAVASNETDVSAVAANGSDISAVAGIAGQVTTVAGISGDVTTVSGIATDVSTVANNVTDVTNFASVYLGAGSSDPTTRTDGSPLQVGDLYFDTTGKVMNVWEGVAWVPAATSSLGGLLTGFGTFGFAPDGEVAVGTFTTLFVWVNGSLLKEGAGYTQDGSSFTILNPQEGDEWAYWAYQANDATDYYTKIEADAEFYPREDVDDLIDQASNIGVNRNYLVNSDWSINQEVIDLSGGVTLAQGEYFRDRWSATSGGADLTYDGTTATLDGAIGTVIEGQSWAGRQVTFSLENPAGDVHVGISAFESGSGSVNGLITAGSGQRSVTLTIPGTATGSLVLELATTEAVDFDARMKLEVGTRATLWEPPDELEIQRCQKHWCKSFLYEAAITDPVDPSVETNVHLGACANASGLTDCPQYFPIEMRAEPEVTLLGMTAAGKWIYYPGSGSWVNIDCVPNRVTTTGFAARVTIGSLSFKDAVFFQGHWIADARPDMSTVNSSWVGLL